MLANVSSKLLSPKDFSRNNFSIELIFRPSIPNNITNWRVFYDDIQILKFLTNEDTFKDSVIDEISHDEDLRYFSGIHPHYSMEKYFDTVKSIPSSILRWEKIYDI